MPDSRRGATAVEYAIVLPVFLMFVLGLIDCSRLIWSYATLSRAAEDAARCAVVNTVSCGSATDITTYAAGQAWGLGAAPVFTVTSPTPACGQQVNGTLTFTFIIPWFYGTEPVGNAMTLNATACYPS
jgi:Flp pilus assembly protein TadG